MAKKNPKQNQNQNQKQEYANAYDKILKENLIETIKPFFKQLFGFEIENKQIEYIQPSLQKTMEVEADFLAKIKHQNPADDFVLHIEFQTKDHLTMELRMNFYQGFIRTSHNISIQQYVIYLGKGKSQMKTFIKDKNLDFRYDLINFEDIDVDTFINSDIPEVVILGILADYKGKKPENIVDIIIEKVLNTNVALDKKRKCVKQLEVLSKLRNLQETIQQKTNNMAFEYDIETDIRYLQGIGKGEEIGIEKGLEKGIEKGRKEGREETVYDSILRMNEKKMDSIVIADILNVTEQKVIEIINKEIKNKQK